MITSWDEYKITIQGEDIHWENENEKCVHSLMAKTYFLSIRWPVFRNHNLKKYANYPNWITDIKKTKFTHFRYFDIVMQMFVNGKYVKIYVMMWQCRMAMVQTKW